ncbi:hypothetical protein ACA910_006978 [Epithemia clementina (nom. ined.)]
MTTPMQPQPSRSSPTRMIAKMRDLAMDRWHRQQQEAQQQKQEQHEHEEPESGQALFGFVGLGIKHYYCGPSTKISDQAVIHFSAGSKFFAFFNVAIDYQECHIRECWIMLSEQTERRFPVTLSQTAFDPTVGSNSNDAQALQGKFTEAINSTVDFHFSLLGFPLSFTRIQMSRPLSAQ